VAADIDACIRGRSLQLEVKRLGEHATLLQQKRLEEWRRAGAIVGTVHSVGETKAILQENCILPGQTTGRGHI
jgi:hypothetical protein